MAVLASVGLPHAARLGPTDPVGPDDVWTLVLVVFRRVRGGAAGGLREACLWFSHLAVGDPREGVALARGGWVGLWGGLWVGPHVCRRVSRPFPA